MNDVIYVVDKHLHLFTIVDTQVTNSCIKYDH
jgi:hypothetical protein